MYNVRIANCKLQVVDSELKEIYTNKEPRVALNLTSLHKRL